MLKLIKNWLQDKAVYIAVIITVTIVFLSLLNPSSIPTPSIHVSDKIMHTFAYFSLMLSWKFVFNKRRELRISIIIFFLLFLFGIVLELLQASLTTYRTADWRDVIANTIGLLMGLLMYPTLYKTIFKTEKI